MANRTNRKKLKYVKGPRYMTEFCYGSLINFYVVLSLWYFKTFVLSHCGQLCDDMAPSPLLKMLERLVYKVTPHHIIDSRDSIKVFIYQGFKTTTKIIRDPKQNSTIYQGP